MEFWKKKIKNSNKLDFYRKFKHEYKAEEYLDMAPTMYAKRDYIKFRTSNHKLAVEILRYKRPIVPREQRLCELCTEDKIEDEFHMIFECTTYKNIREIYFQKIHALIACNHAFKDEFIETIFKSLNTPVIIYTSNFIKKCFTKRKSLLQSLVT